MHIVDPIQMCIPEYEVACNMLRKFRKHEVMCVLETWVNSWSKRSFVASFLCRTLLPNASFASTNSNSFLSLFTAGD